MTSDLSLLDWEPKGATALPEDTDRLRTQLRAVRFLMLDGKPRTLREISASTGAPEASVSARLRDLRSRGYSVERERIGKGLFSYRVVPKVETPIDLSAQGGR